MASEILERARQQEARFKRKLYPWIGLAAIALYWLSVHPTGLRSGSVRPYFEDLCFMDMMRALLADGLAAGKGISFFSPNMMYPDGVSLIFNSWSLDRDMLGAFAWLLNPDFPYHWVALGLSLAMTYFGVGLILRKMGLKVAPSWSLAALVVIFNIPRHNKLWHHSDLTFHHWSVLSIFVDAWIWHRFWRNRQWSLSLELLRLFLFQATFLSGGYFWAAGFLLYFFHRVALAIAYFVEKRRGSTLSFEWPSRRQILAWVGASTILLSIQAPWFYAIWQEASKATLGDQSPGFYTPVSFFLRPLWWDWLAPWIQSTFGWQWNFRALDYPETVSTIGWIYWGLLAVGFWALHKVPGSPGRRVYTPWLCLIFLIFMYMAPLGFPVFQGYVQMFVPFMKFFRVVSRWGLLLPAILTATFVLAWPEISIWYERNLPRLFDWRRGGLLVVGLLLSIAIELGALGRPTNRLPPLPRETETLLTELRDSPGKAVLDLPFCVAGGNGICPQEACPNYPLSVAPQCVRLWHKKAIFGLYQSRMNTEQCNSVMHPPITTWQSAWLEHRCLREQDWEPFCKFLDERSDLAAVLVYPEIWGINDDCVNELTKHLGEPVAQARFLMKSSREIGTGAETRILRYGARCRGI